MAKSLQYTTNIQDNLQGYTKGAFNTALGRACPWGCPVLIFKMSELDQQKRVSGQQSEQLISRDIWLSVDDVRIEWKCS